MPQATGLGFAAMDTQAEDRTERDHAPARIARAGWPRSVALRRARLRRWWRGLSRPQEALLLALTCVVALGFANAFVAQPYVIPSGSMEDTLRVGDRVLVDKLAYRSGAGPRRGDVIVFDGVGSFVQDPPEENPVLALARRVGSLFGLAQPPDTDYVKRVIGVGGDRVTCCDVHGRITVNGHPIDESGYLHPGDAASSVPFDIIVPPGRLWVMGDHRSASSDSRDHLGDPGGGTVPVDRVIGRAQWIIWPIDRARSLNRPRTFGSVPSPSGGAHG